MERTCRMSRSHPMRRGPEVRITGLHRVGGRHLTIPFAALRADLRRAVRVERVDDPVPVEAGADSR
jgi:hypothetical protein